MVEKTITIVNKTGMHARPASQFVKMAVGFKSNIQLIKDDKIANGKSLINLLSMGINMGSAVTLKVEGEDEVVCLDTLSDFLANLQE